VRTPDNTGAIKIIFSELVTYHHSWNEKLTRDYETYSKIIKGNMTERFENNLTKE
jgi:hypothetical protein